MVQNAPTNRFIRIKFSNNYFGKSFFQLIYAAITENGNGNGNGSSEMVGMTAAILEQPPDKEIPLSDPTVDAREVYLKELFAPNRFSALTLQKALGVSYMGVSEPK